MDSGDQITVEMRLAAIEEKLDRLLAHFGLDGDGSTATGQTETQRNNEAQLNALIQAGKKIQAIKVLREATGLGLKDAKNTIEVMEQHLRARGGWR